MGKHSLEEYLKGRIRGHREPINTDDLWSALDLEPKKKKPWWILAAIVLLMATCIGLQTLPQKEQTFSHTEKENKLDKDTNETNNIEQKNPRQKTDAKASKDTNKEDADHLMAADQTSIINHTKTKKSKRILESAQASSPFPQDEIERLVYTSTASEKTTQNATMALSEEPDIPLSKKAFQAPYNQLKENLDITKLPTIWKGLHWKTRVLDIEQTPAITSRSDQQAWTLNPGAITAYTGFYWVDRTLSLASDTLGEYLDLRNMTETSLESWMLGGQIQYMVNPNWYLKCGLEYQSINERFNVQITNDSTFFKEDEPIVLLVEASGDTIVEDIGLAEFQSSRTEIWEHYNYHRLINIPVSIGYAKQKEDWSFFVEAIPLLSLYRGFNGKMLNMEGDNVIDNPAYFENKVGLGIRFNAGVNYHWKDWNFYLAPSAQQYLFSVAKDGFNIQQNYRMLGGNIGVRRLF